MERQNFGKYEIRGVLGRGNTGTVYDGWDPVIGRRVAIKTLKLPDASTPEGQDQLQRFRREAHVTGRLSHPNIIAIHDYVETTAMAYIVMELINGTDPVTFIKQRSTSSSEIVRIVRDVLTALQFSHENGVVHRDVKPSNVMVTPTGHVKVGDFGVARIEDSRLTQWGTQIGTPAYMSPEQLTGEPADARSDIYSTGVVLYQLLAGEKPFEGSLTSIIHKVLHTRPPRPSALSLNAPPILDAVVERAMARRPEDRFRTAAEFSKALAAAAVDQTEVPAAAVTPSEAEATTNVVNPRLSPAGIGGTASTQTARPRRGMRIIGGLILVAALGSGSAYLASNWPPLATQRTQLATSRAATPAPAAPGPAAETMFGPPRNGKTLSEALMTFIPPEQQTAERDKVDRYARSTMLHRSLAVSSDGRTWWSGPFGSSREARDGVLEGCQIVYGGLCGTAAVDDSVPQGPLAGHSMPRVTYSGFFDPAQIPTVRPPRLLEADIADYTTALIFKAMALHPWGRLFAADAKNTQQQADDAALAACAEDPDRRGSGGPCYLYAEGDTVVLARRIVGRPRPPAEALGPDALLEPLINAFPRITSLRSDARTFLALGLNRAMAINPHTGYTTWWARRPTAAEAESGASEWCELNSGSPCLIAVVNNDIRDGSRPVINQPRVAYAGSFNPLWIPAITLSERSSARVTEYAIAPGFRAMALHPAGRVYTSVGKNSQAAADDDALDVCSRAAEAEPCFLYASGNRVVLAARQTRTSVGQSPPAR